MGNLLSQIQDHLTDFNEILANEDEELFLDANDKIAKIKNYLNSSEFINIDLFSVHLKEVVEHYKTIDKSILLKVEASYFVVFSVIEEWIKMGGYDDEDMGFFMDVERGKLVYSQNPNAYRAYFVRKFGERDANTKMVFYSINGRIRFTMSYIFLCGYEAAMKDELSDSILDVLIILLTETSKEIFGAKKNKNDTPNSSGGCYVATCVYGSYDCPQVWMLRRYRDYYLDNRWFGRLFIKMYYCISPTLVKFFGKSKLFKAISLSILNSKIKKLKEKNYLDTPYIDKDY